MIKEVMSPKLDAQLRKVRRILTDLDATDAQHDELTELIVEFRELWRQHGLGDLQVRENDGAGPIATHRTLPV